MAPAQGAGGAGSGGGMVPFMVASNEYSEWFFTDTVTPSTSAQEFIHPVTPGGFLRGITLVVYTSTAGASGTGSSATPAINPDAPWSGFSSFAFENIDGAPIRYPQPLYNYYLINKYLQPWLQGDPQADPNFGGATLATVYGLTKPGISFTLKIAVEVRDTAAVLANTDARAQYRIRYTVSPWAGATTQNSFLLTSPTAGSGEVIPTFNVMGFVDTWAQVDATDLAGHPQQQLPDGLVLQRITRRETQTIQSPGGSNTLKHNNMGNELRGWLYVTRNTSNYRCNAFGAGSYRTTAASNTAGGTQGYGGNVTLANQAGAITNGLRLRLDNRQLFYTYAAKNEAETLDFLRAYAPGSSVAQNGTQATGSSNTDMGVYFIPRYRLRGADVGSYWLDTTTATFLQLECSTVSATAMGTDASGTANSSNFAGTGTVDIVTDEMVPAGIVPAAFEGL